MTEFSHSAETNTIPPLTTEELLQQLRDTATPSTMYLPEGFSGALCPDTPEEAEMRAKEIERTEHDFKILWDLNTERLAAERAARTEQQAKVIPIDRNRARWLGQTLNDGQLKRQAR